MIDKTIVKDEDLTSSTDSTTQPKVDLRIASYEPSLFSRNQKLAITRLSYSRSLTPYEKMDETTDILNQVSGPETIVVPDSPQKSSKE